MHRLRDAVAALFEWAKEASGLFAPDSMERGENLWKGVRRVVCCPLF